MKYIYKASNSMQHFQYKTNNVCATKHKLFITGPILVVKLVIGLVCVCVSVQTHISITSGRNVLILGMVMGYGVGLIPVVSKF